MPNKLIAEQSVYLLQHAHNPVDWYPWGAEAFERAAREDKPILVSIGYAACHWCHVMERESFEDADVAQFMNENFVCIKVDREEHPEVDHMYMDAVTAISGSGGWPLNVFTTPGRQPFYGGTYFPPQPAYHRPSWSQILFRMAEIWHDRRDEVQGQAEQLIAHIRQANEFAKSAPGADSISPDTCSKIAADMVRRSDRAKGGFGAAPKFPFSMAITFLLQFHRATGNAEALGEARRALDAMACGGIYDHLGGGFARYSTDAAWLAPHFEKMLYDNALLIMTYAEAWRATGQLRYRTVVTETISFINRELKHEGGGFFAALDADSEGVEGKYYTWSLDEVDHLLGPDAGIYADYYGITETGNWEHTNIIHISDHSQTTAGRFGIGEEALQKRLTSGSGKLYAHRAHRIRPVTDDKCLLSWNALMNAALCRAGALLDTPEYIAQACAHMDWMLRTYPSGNGMNRSWKEGIARIGANLDDYAALIYALVQLASTAGETAYLSRAVAYTQVVIARFGDNENDYFWFTSADTAEIPVRKVELYDGATPSGNALMAYNLMVLGICMGENAWTERALRMAGKMAAQAAAYSISYGLWASIILSFSQEMNVVVCLGESSDAVRRKWLPKAPEHGYLVTSKKEISDIPLLEKKYFADKTHIFVCSRHACRTPVDTVDEVWNMIGNASGF